jgi:hypothetical protein
MKNSDDWNSFNIVLQSHIISSGVKWCISKSANLGPFLKWRIGANTAGIGSASDTVVASFGIKDF